MHSTKWNIFNAVEYNENNMTKIKELPMLKKLSLEDIYNAFMS